MISMGGVAERLVVNLARDADFVATLRAAEDWPDGTQIELRFALATTVTTWSATISGTDATWDVPRTDVAVLLLARPRDVRLHYWRADGTELLWAKGQVVDS